MRWAREIYDALGKTSSGRAYVNFLDEGQDRVRAAYGEEKYARLAALKRTYDPDNIFRLNANIEPAAAPPAGWSRRRVPGDCPHRAAAVVWSEQR